MFSAVVFLIIFPAFVIPSDIPCDGQSDCHRGGKLRCAVCVDGNTKEKGRCIFPFPYMFEENTMCEYLSKCTNGCNSHGECYMHNKGSSPVPYCYCKEDFYGFSCQDRSPSGYVMFKAVMWWYNAIIKPGEYTHLKLEASSSSKNVFDNSWLIIKTTDGFYWGTSAKKGRSMKACYETDSEYCKLYDASIRFPYKPYTSEKSERFLTFRNEVLGYLTDLPIKVNSYNTYIYKKDYTVFVSYENSVLKCIAVIRLTNCGSSMESPTIFLRSSRIEVHSSTKYIEDGRYVTSSVSKADCAETTSTSWKIFKINRDALVITEEVNSIPVYQNYTSRALILEPYSLDFGTFRVMTEEKHVQSSGVSQNYAYCYLKIQGEPLVAILEGGRERVAYKQFGLKLSAQRSYDPNMPPSKQAHVNVEWSCVNTLHPKVKEDMCARKGFKAVEVYYIPSEKLNIGLYNFTQKVWTHMYDKCTECDQVISPRLAKFTVEVVNAPPNAKENIVIQCVQNCGEKVRNNEMLFLKAINANGYPTNYEYEWTYKTGGTELSTDKIKMEGLPSYMLLLREDVLESGVDYTIVAKVTSIHWLSKYSFETDMMVYEGNCSVHPDAGVKGLTSFDIVCNFMKDATFISEFYDKTLEEVKEGSIFSGRMLGTSHTGQLLDVILTRGQVCVYIMNNKGLFVKKEVTVKLSGGDATPVVMDGLMKNLTNTMKHGDITRTLRGISFIPDMVPQTMDKSKIFHTLLDSLTQIPVVTLADVKLSSSTLANVLLALNKPTQLSLSPRLMMSTLQMVQKQAANIRHSVKNRELSRFMSRKEIRIVVTLSPQMEEIPILDMEIGYYSSNRDMEEQTTASSLTDTTYSETAPPTDSTPANTPTIVTQRTRSLVNCLHAALLCKDKKMNGISEDNADFGILHELKQGSLFAETTIDLAKDILSYIQSPGQPPTRVSSNNNAFIVWVMEDDYKYNISNMLNKDIPVIFPNKLQREFDSHKRQDEHLSLQVVDIDQNIFSWSVSDVKSKLLSVSLAKKIKNGKLNKAEEIRTPLNIVIDVVGNVTNTVVTNVIMQPDPKRDPELLDLDVRVHRLDLAPRSLMSITFLFPSTNSSLRVLIKNQYRPDYSMMVDTSVLITQQSPTYPVVYNTDDDPSFWFMGILPGPEVPVNQSVGYVFEVNTTVCKLWAQGQWSSLGCKIGSNIQGKKVHCQCTHFSIFAAAFPVPPQEVDPFADAKLFLTVLDNPLVVAFIISILLIYVLLCVWLWQKDKRDKRVRDVILLDDNFPEDSYPYMVAVYTSSRFNAGTTAHVGIKIIGTSTSSRAHILSSKDRKVLTNDSDDWFIIYCRDSLGELKSIHIWHDNSGSNPDWFCDKIYVYDLSEKSETLFIVEQWLALRLNYYPEANVLRAAVQDVMSLKRVFLDNFILGMRDNHILCSILLRHPRSNVTRVQRISVFMCCFMVATLCSIMFFVPSDPATQTDDYHYEVGARELYISIESLVISVVITFVVLFAFRRSYKYTYQRGRKSSTLVLRSDDNLSQHPSNPSIASQSNVRRVNSPAISITDKPEVRSERTFYQKYVRFVTNALKSESLNPAQLPLLAPVVTIRKKWFIFAWVSCVTVILVCAYLVMLYGLRIGPVQSYKWLSVVFFSVGEEIFITGPAKIIFYSSLLALAFQRMFDVNTHQVGVGDVRTYQPPTDDEYFNKLLARRNHSMYAPLSTQLRKEMLSKKVVRSHWWQLIDFIVATSFLVMLNTLISRLWSSYFYTNSHVGRMFEIAYHPNLGALPFHDMHNISQVETYLEISLVQTLYNVRWYNDSRITNDEGNTKYWAADYTYKMIGLPVIRQLRVKPEPCNKMVTKRGECSPKLGYGEIDTDVYGVGWTPANWYDASKNNSPWKYTFKSTIFTPFFYRLYGKSGHLYWPGGYLQALGPRRQQTELALAELRENRWQDHRTRVLIIELTLYNANLDLFTQVTLMVEYLASGSVLLKAQALSVEGSRQLNVWIFVLFVFIIYYILRSASLINKLGLLEYLSTVNNVCRLIVVALGCLSIVVYILHYYRSASYSEQFQKKKNESNFNYDFFAMFLAYLQIILSVLLCFAILRVIMLTRGGRSLITYWYTFTISLSWLFWLSFMVSLFILMLYQIPFLLNKFLGHWNHGFLMARGSLRNVTFENTICMHVRVFIHLKVIFTFIVSSFYMILFMYYARVARAYKPKDSDNFNLVTFFVAQLTKKYKSITN